MMIWVNAEITEAFIGLEDHGIFAWGITFTGPGWGQGSGMRGLDPESLPTLKAIVTHFGPWTKLKGKVVRIGREGGHGSILGMCDILDDSKEVLF